MLLLLAYLFGKSENIGILGTKTTITPTIIEKPSPTPVIPTLTPFPTSDPNPIINCLIDEKCGGSSIALKQSECKNSTCCQIGEKWIFYTSNTKCNQDQEAYNNSDPIVNCNALNTGFHRVKRSVCKSSTDCQDGKGGYVFIPYDECKKIWEEYSAKWKQLSNEYRQAMQENIQLNSLYNQIQMQKIQNQFDQA